MDMKKVLPKAVPALLLIAGIAGVLIFRHEQELSKRLTFYGNVDIRQIQTAFYSTGRIQQMLAREGDAVTNGQLIAELDATRYEAAAAKAEAQVAMQQQVVARMLAGSRPEEIVQAQARVREAEAALTDALQKQVRAQALAKEEYVSQQQLDDARTAVDTKRANLEAVRQSAELAVLGPRKEDIAAAQAQLSVYEAALKLAKQELADSKLYAPADGIIQNRILEPGDMASPQSPVYTLALNNPVWVRAYVPEPDLGKISAGLRAEVRTDSFPGKVYEGWVGYISPSSEFTPKQVETTDLRTRLVYQVRIYVKNPQNELRLGMPATVKILTGSAQEN
ncbi:MAG TPA: efflux RND transporter periplasmic adaptor subunit [Pontiellaceae bacterium]|nr:efflux RND transporter periplasmic adaptor subunit [Pontiellaceae bacterium]